MYIYYYISLYLYTSISIDQKKNKYVPIHMRWEESDEFRIRLRVGASL